MIANRILFILSGVLSFLVVPVQHITTFILGILVSLSFGILLLPLSLIWILLFLPLIGVSWVTKKMEWLRNPIGLLGIPWAIVADIYICLTPSMGELESRAAKAMLAQSWPYSWECWRFQIGKSDLYDPENYHLREVIESLTHNNPLMERIVNRMVAGEALDPNI